MIPPTKATELPVGTTARLEVAVLLAREHEHRGRRGCRPVGEEAKRILCRSSCWLRRGDWLNLRLCLDRRLDLVGGLGSKRSEEAVAGGVVSEVFVQPT